jgi:hypothetical protein
MQYRYDQLQFSSVIPNFINIGHPTGSVTASGTIPNLSGANFTVNITLGTLNTFMGVFATNQNTGKRTFINNGSAIATIWQFVSSETVQDTLTFLGTTATFTIQVSNNTGGSITLTSQTYSIEVVEYQIAYL